MQDRAAPDRRRADPREREIETPVLLFRGLDGARRALRLAIVERIEDVAGDAIRPGAGKLRVPLGERDPAAGRAATARSTSGKVRLFRLTDGAREIAYAFCEVIDFARSCSTSSTPTRPGEIAGVPLIDGAPVELVDPHWLFAQHVGAAARRDASSRSAACLRAIPGCRTCCARSSRLPAIASVGDGEKPRPTSSSRREAPRAMPAADADHVLRTEPEPRGRRTRASTATTAPAC